MAVCGARTLSSKKCQRSVSAGHKRCFQHKHNKIGKSKGGLPKRLTLESHPKNANHIHRLTEKLLRSGLSAKEKAELKARVRLRDQMMQRYGF